MRLVFLGPPGAGKGTQAKRMAREFALRHASTGDMFREAVGAGSELGRTVRSYLDSGKLVPDALTSRVVKEMVLECSDSYILDGYPRTMGQAQDLEKMLQERGETLDAVLYFELGRQEAVRRLSGRLVCNACGANFHREFMPPRVADVCDCCGGPLTVRGDSTEEVIRQRLAEYEEKTYPLVPYYAQRGLLRKVDAGQDPGDVASQSRAVLTKLGASGMQSEVAKPGK